MTLFYQPLIPQGVHFLDEDESRHCVKVLRQKKGDSLRITDGAGNFYDARITADDPRKCGFEIVNIVSVPGKPYKITIAISPTKNADRLEWFVEKAVELGIDSIIIMECRHTERTHLKTERLHKVAISAMKQSVKAHRPSIEGIVPFKTVVEMTKSEGRFIAYVDTSNPDHLNDLAKANKDNLVLIGPEGDFSNEELEHAFHFAFKKVSLGASRLRTETAGLAACHILNLINS